MKPTITWEVTPDQISDCSGTSIPITANCSYTDTTHNPAFVVVAPFCPPSRPLATDEFDRCRDNTLASLFNKLDEIFTDPKYRGATLDGADVDTHRENYQQYRDALMDEVKLSDKRRESLNNRLNNRG